MPSMPSPRRIDIHIHLIPQFYQDAIYEAGSGPAIGRYPDWSPELALDLMDKAGIEVGLLSLAQPGVQFGDPKKAPALARRCNEYSAELNVRWPARFGSLAGTSAAMRTTFALLEKAATSDATVLLEGETGTGKSQAARALHKASPRKDKRFHVVDCTQMSSSLLESELFGHEKGAFTGATNSRIGAFEAAQGGTIFLDEVGELPSELQPKLLRLLENGEVLPVGADRPHRVDVLLIAATNRDLEALVRDGSFRHDLWARLARARRRLLLPSRCDRLRLLATVT